MSIIPILSLAVALLTVLVGPLVSWAIAKRSMMITQRTSARQLVLPMPQAWLNELRTKLAELIAITMHYYVAGYDDRTDEEYRNLGLLEQQLKLLLDPANSAHQKLVRAIRNAVEAIGGVGPKGHERFAEAHLMFERLARELVQEEWASLQTPVYEQGTKTGM